MKKFTESQIEKLLQIKKLATSFVLDATGSWDTYEGDRLLKLAKEFDEEIKE